VSPASLVAGLVSLTVALTPVLGSAAPARALVAEGPSPAQSAEAASEAPSEAAVRAALEDGDLTTARELAVARSEAEASADNYILEAEVELALGDYEGADAALRGAIDALPEDADERVELAERRAEIEALARGTRADEPASTHRERLDRERAERLAVPEPPPSVEPIDAPAKTVPIIKKWYFWVTLTAIVATAGGIVGVAIASAVDDRRSRAASRTEAPTAGGLTIRF
jgi:hypothetical protein